LRDATARLAAATFSLPLDRLAAGLFRPTTRIHAGFRGLGQTPLDLREFGVSGYQTAAGSGPAREGAVGRRLLAGPGDRAPALHASNLQRIVERISDARRREQRRKQRPRLGADLEIVKNGIERRSVLLQTVEGNQPRTSAAVLFEPGNRCTSVLRRLHDHGSGQITQRGVQKRRLLADVPEDVGQHTAHTRKATGIGTLEQRTCAATEPLAFLDEALQQLAPRFEARSLTGEVGGVARSAILLVARLAGRLFRRCAPLLERAQFVLGTLELQLRLGARGLKLPQRFRRVRRALVETCAAALQRAQLGVTVHLGVARFGLDRE